MDSYQGVYPVAFLVILEPSRCLYNGGQLQWTVTKVCTLWPSWWSWSPQDAYIMEVNYNGPPEGCKLGPENWSCDIGEHSGFCCQQLEMFFVTKWEFANTSWMSKCGRTGPLLCWKYVIMSCCCEMHICIHKYTQLIALGALILQSRK